MVKRLSVIFTSTVIAIAAGSPAFGQSLEEVIVTATKREQSLQDIPVAVSVTTAETLETAQIIDITDLQSVVPSLRVTQLQTSGNTNFIIRGFGNGANNPGIEPSVGVFIDGVYRSRSSGALSDMNDIERIEVLRGPQSTLFGKNASAGVISIITSKPAFDFGGGAQLTAGNHGQLIGRANVTGPLTENIAYSLNVSGNIRDGYFDNLEDSSEFNERGRWSVRGQMLFEPTENSSIRVIADMDRIDEICCGVVNLLDGPTGPVIRLLGGQIVAEDPYARDGYFNIPSVNDIENNGISVQADVDFERFSLVSITSVRNQDKYERADSDFTSADLIGSNELLTDIETFTQEVRLSSSGDGDVDWMIGAFYFDEKVAFRNNLVFGNDFRRYVDTLAGGAISGLEPALMAPAGSFLSAGQGTFDSSGQDDTALSIFGQADWHVSDRTTFSLGLNNTSNKKDAFVTSVATDTFSAVDFVQVGFAGLFQAFTGGQAPTPANFAAFPAEFSQAQALSTVACTPQNEPLCNSALALQPLQFVPQFVNFPNAVESGKSDDSETTWTARVAFDVNDTYNVYASASTGFKATSWNLSRDSRPFPSSIAAITNAGLNTPNLVPGTRFAGPEKAKVYELGLKARFEQGALNLAVFEQSIKGFQSNIFTGTGFALANAGKQSTKGLEVDGTWMARDDLQLTLAATFLDPVFDSFVGANGVNGSEDLSGQKPAGVHEVSIVTSGTYYHEFANGIEGYLRGEYIYEDEVQVIENVPAALASRKVSMINASAGLTWSNGFELSLWGRNINDDEYLLSAFPTVAQTGSYSGYPNPPRTYGLTARMKF